MRSTSEDPFDNVFSPAEIEAMRRAARDEESLKGDFWTLLRKVGRRVPFAEDALAAFYCATDPSTERRVKLILLAAIGYFVLPIDVIPDVLPILGFTDDAAVIATALSTVARAMKPEHRERAREELNRDA